MARSWTDNQVATHAGKPDGCITRSTERVLTYWDSTGGVHTNGLTTDVLGALMIGGKNPAGKTYGELGLPMPSLGDVSWGVNEQNKTSPHCAGGGPTPTPTPGPTPPPTGTAEFWLGGPAGATFNIDNGVQTGTFSCHFNDGMHCVIKRTVSIPGTHSVRIDMADCAGYDSGDDYYIQGGAKHYFFKDEKDLGCEYDYFATVNVNAYDANGHLIDAIAGVYGTSNKKLTPCALKVSTNETGTKSVTISVKAPGKETEKRALSVYNGAVLTEDFYLHDKKIIIHITSPTYFIDDFGGADEQMWPVGTIKEPSGSNWVSVETTEAHKFWAVLYFVDPDTGVKSSLLGDIYTEAKFMHPGMSGDDTKLYWPYLVDTPSNPTQWTPTQWEVLRSYMGTWELWADLYIIG